MFGVIYHDESGNPISGWQHIYHSGQWDYYYFENGVMHAGWLVWGGSWFYLANGYGQDVGFYDKEYGVCRMGWQDIYHSTGWDTYYFRGAGSGRMETGWLNWDGYTYYLGNDIVGFPFNNPAHGTMLKGIYKIGAYNYVFKDDHGSISGSQAWNYPVGSMLRNMTYIEVLNPNGSILLIGWIDEYGHLYLYGAKSSSELPETVLSEKPYQVVAGVDFDENDPLLYNPPGDINEA